jgi:hypothetical protein
MNAPLLLGFSHRTRDLLFLSGSREVIIMLNVYGPYIDMVDYWNRFFKMDRVRNGLVVIRGDLNLILGYLEV